MEIRDAGCPLGAKCEEVKQEGNKQVMYRCPWYTQVRGLDPNTGQEIDHWGCAIAWMPTLMVNTANEARKTTAATEDFRNRMMDVRQIQTAQALRAIRVNDAGFLEEKECDSR